MKVYKFEKTYVILLGKRVIKLICRDSNRLHPYYEKKEQIKREKERIIKNDIDNNWKEFQISIDEIESLAWKAFTVKDIAQIKLEE